MVLLSSRRKKGEKRETELRENREVLWQPSSGLLLATLIRKIRGVFGDGGEKHMQLRNEGKIGDGATTAQSEAEANIEKPSDQRRGPFWCAL